MPKERIEDLGRLRELLNAITNHEIFELVESTGCRRPKDFTEQFETLTDERKEDLLHKLAYGLDSVHEKILECWIIARGDEED